MSTTVTAAVLVEAGQPLEFRDVVVDDPMPHEVLVRVERVGLCHSDVHYTTGALRIDTPAILGHEVSGIVVQVGSAVSRVRAGDRVVASVTPACGGCKQCLRGRPTQCERVDEVRARSRPSHTAEGKTIATLGGIGAFAQVILATEAALAVVDAAMPPEVACLLGCCVTTGVGAVIHGAQVTPGDTVAVIGCGGVGIAVIQGARLAGARRIIALDTVEARLRGATSFGATDVVRASSDNTETLGALRNLLPEGVTHAFEAVGRPSTAQLAFSCLAPMGIATILGLMPEGSQLVIPADDLVYRDRAVRGAYMGANRFLSDVNILVDHYRSGRLDLDAMVTGVVPFGEINDGFRRMSEPENVRVVVDMTAGPS